MLMSVKYGTTRRSRQLEFECKADRELVVTHALQFRVSEGRDLYTDLADRHRFPKAEADTGDQRSLSESAADLDYSRQECAHAAHISDGLKSSVPRRGYPSQPRVATTGSAPWENGRRRSNPEGVAHPRDPCGTPSGFVFSRRVALGCAPCWSRPWAVMCRPRWGAEVGSTGVAFWLMADRWLRLRRAGPICAICVSPHSETPDGLLVGGSLGSACRLQRGVSFKSGNCVAPCP